MGRRTRKRRAASPGGPPTPPPPSPARPRPDPPWAPFPLVELAILIGIVLIVVGFLSHGPRARLLFGLGLGLACLATFEQTVREHFAGYRAHSALLAGAGAVAVAALLYAFTRLAQPLPVVIAVAVFISLFSLLRAAYTRAGGLSTSSSPRR
jgi:hypothetical protein